MRTIKYLSILAAVAAVASCDLNEEPKDSLSPDSFFHTESELELYTNQFYLLEPDAESLYRESSNLLIDGLTPADVVVGLNRQVPASGGGWSWEDLRHINYYLQNSGNCKDAEAKAKFDGMAYFWRAWFYFDKLQRFGAVPWYDKVIGSADTEMLTKPRDSRDVIFGHILEDLDKAIEALPAPSSVYKVNRNTALALKSRACLFEGTFRKYHAGHTFNKENLPYEDILNKCVEASGEIMESGKYKIYKTGKVPYQSMFSGGDATKVGEIIFARCFGGNFKHLVDAFALVSSKGMAGFTKALVDSYLMKDGSRFTDKAGWRTETFQNEIADRDPRLAQTVLTAAGKYPDGTDAKFDFSSTVTGYPMLKYVNGTITARNSSSVNDMPVFRLAEVLLNYAEAKAELGTLTQDDLDKSVNMLRDRVDMPHLNLAEANASPDPFLTSDEFGYKNVSGSNKGVILEIRRERGIEMVGEGLRYYDIIRWREGRLFAQPFYGPYVPGEGVYDMDGDGKSDFAVYKTTKPTVAGVVPVQLDNQIFLSEGDKGFIIAHKTVVRSFNEDRDYLYPIPSNERVLSKGALTQNPGWDDGLTF